MRELVPDRLWVREMPLRLFGVELGTRMSIVRLSGQVGGLWLHSPVALDRPGGKKGYWTWSLGPSF